jgi:hypothetical protein
MNVKEIVTKYLKANDFDGLVNTDVECGCQLSDIFCCDSYCADCRPAYKVKPDKDSEWDNEEWIMSTRKRGRIR